MPDLISILDRETAEPITTENLKYGQRVRVVGCSVPPIMRSERALEVWGPQAFGFDEPFRAHRSHDSTASESDQTADARIRASRAALGELAGRLRSCSRRPHAARIRGAGGNHRHRAAARASGCRTCRSRSPRSAQREIEARGIGSTRDVLPTIPNVTYDESFTIGNSFVSVRGVAQINNADSPVAIVVDGVPQNSQKQLRMELFDVERIEVLKGPQGALYGRNAIGGAINIVTQRAVERARWLGRRPAAARATCASASGAVSGPDRRGQGCCSAFPAPTRTRTATIDNVFLDEKVDFFTSKDVRGRLLFMPTDALDDRRARVLVEPRRRRRDGCIDDRRAIRQREPRSAAAFRHPRQQRARDHATRP